MITPEEFVRRWRFSPLIPVPEEKIEASNLSEVAKRFLAAGIPSIPLEQLDFSILAEGLRSLASILADKDDVPMLSNYFVLGHWSEASAYICLDQNREGQIVELSVNDHMIYEPLFVNTDLPSFLETLLIYNELDRLIALEPDNTFFGEIYLPSGELIQTNLWTHEGRAQFVHAVTPEINRIDSAALRGDETFWKNRLYPY